MTGDVQIFGFLDGELSLDSFLSPPSTFFLCGFHACLLSLFFFSLSLCRNITKNPQANGKRGDKLLLSKKQSWSQFSGGDTRLAFLCCLCFFSLTHMHDGVCSQRTDLVLQRCQFWTVMYLIMRAVLEHLPM
jgi:hypothetical protein